MYSFTGMVVFLGAVSLGVSVSQSEEHDVNISAMQRRMLETLPWPVRLRVLENMRRAPQIEGDLAQDYKEKLGTTDSTDKAEQEAIRVKLFKMSYKSVQHCEELVKRVRVVEKVYKDDQNYLLGFSVAHMTYLFNEMSEMAVNFKRFWHKWSVAEHISAYLEFSERNKDIKRLTDALREYRKPFAGADKSEEFSDIDDSYKSAEFKKDFNQKIKGV